MGKGMEIDYGGGTTEIPDEPLTDSVKSRALGQEYSCFSIRRGTKTAVSSSFWKGDQLYIASYGLLVGHRTMGI